MGRIHSDAWTGMKSSPQKTQRHKPCPARGDAAEGNFMKMQCKIRFVILMLVIGALALAPAAEAKKLKVITTLTDLASLTQEVGGDKVEVEALARGYQDPHFVDPKPSFLLKLRNADLLVSVGLELEIGWLPPLITQSGNGRIQPGAPGYLD